MSGRYVAKQNPGEYLKSRMLQFEKFKRLEEKKPLQIF